MAAYNYRSPNLSLGSVVNRLRPGLAFIVIIFGALIAFEVFNYSTTDRALSDLLGDPSFVGIPWSTILAIAFCGIDFAGIARLFTPEQGMDEPKEVWYLFGAWLLAATMNAILTWWGVSMAIEQSHTAQTSVVLDPKTIMNVVPVFVAVLVWLIRILIIGTLSLSMDRLLHPGAEQRVPLQNAVSAPAAHAYNRTIPQPQLVSQPQAAAQPRPIAASLNTAGVQPRPAMSRSAATARPARSVEPPAENDLAPKNPLRPEPTYHSLAMSARPAANPPAANNTEPGTANRYRKA